MPDKWFVSVCAVHTAPFLWELIGPSCLWRPVLAATGPPQGVAWGKPHWFRGFNSAKSSVSLVAKWAPVKGSSTRVAPGRLSVGVAWGLHARQQPSVTLVEKYLGNPENWTCWRLSASSLHRGGAGEGGERPGCPLTISDVQR